MFRVAALLLAAAALPLPAAAASPASPDAAADAVPVDLLGDAPLRPAVYETEVASLTPSDDVVVEMPMEETEEPALRQPNLAARIAMAPKLVARVSLKRQEMTVIVDGAVRHVWKVSTAGSGYRTPQGVWTPYRMHTMWHSRKYDNAPMPHSIFFTGGYAIHATPYVKRLGRPASHGCVRLSPENARELFAMARSFGRDRMRVVVEN